jgi:hypothetical protein
MIDSHFSLTAFFPKIFFTMLFITISTNLQPSSAGIGRRLKTQRLIDIMAHKIRRNTNPLSRDFVTKSTTPIGQLT